MHAERLGEVRVEEVGKGREARRAQQPGNELEISDDFDLDDEMLFAGGSHTQQNTGQGDDRSELYQEVDAEIELQEQRSNGTMYNSYMSNFHSSSNYPTNRFSCCFQRRRKPEMCFMG